MEVKVERLLRARGNEGHQKYPLNKHSQSLYELTETEESCTEPTQVYEVLCLPG